MSVTVHRNLVLVRHIGEGNAELGKRITDDMRAAIKTLRQQHLRIGIYHDVSGLETANTDYVNAFAALAKELGTQGFIYTATIPKAWVRVLAKTASVLGGIETHFYKSEEETFAYLKSVGFDLPAAATSPTPRTGGLSV